MTALRPIEERDADALACLSRIKTAFDNTDYLTTELKDHILENASVLAGWLTLARDDRDRVQDVIKLTVLHSNKAHTAFITTKHIASVVCDPWDTRVKITMDSGETFVTEASIDTIVRLAGWRYHGSD